MNIYPKDGMIELDDFQRSLNLTCTVRELSTHKIDPLRLKWYHKQDELHLLRHSHLVHSRSHPHQASLILSIHPRSPNESGLFRCIYEHGQISKDVHVFYTSSGKSLPEWEEDIHRSLSSSAWLFEIDQSDAMVVLVVGMPSPSSPSDAHSIAQWIIYFALPLSLFPYVFVDRCVLQCLLSCSISLYTRCLSFFLPLARFSAVHRSKLRMKMTRERLSA